VDAGKQLKHDIISLLFNNKISLYEARNALNVSERTVWRYLESFQTKGPTYFLHGNLGRSPVNKTTSELISRSKVLMKDKYFDFNMTHALEKLFKDDGIKINRETFRKICHEIGMVKKAHRRQSHARKVRDRITQEGVMLQMDGSPHRWFGSQETCLIGVIDDATSEVHGAEFFESETTMGCMKVLRDVIQKKGLFSILYTDKAGIFGGQKRVSFSQVKRALEELGISIIFANSPQAKGRVERLWGTLQDRLIPEMRIRKITSMGTSNHFLQTEYLPDEHNKRFKVLPRNLVPAWRPLPAEMDLDQIFCLKDRRTVKNDHTFSWNNVLYKIISELKHSIQNQKVEIRTYLDGTWKVFFADLEIEVAQHHIQPKMYVVEKAVVVEYEKDTIKVRKDSHVEYQNKYYSVDPVYIGKKVQVIASENTVIIYHERKIIETHKKVVGQFLRASTKPEHLAPWQSTLKLGSVYRRAAGVIGPSCDKIIFTILQRGQGVVDNKSIWAILGLRKEYARASVEEACKLAYETGSCDYRGVATILGLRYRKQVIAG
jgi:transposase